MSKNIDKTVDSSSSKALLYSELLNASGHVQELLQKKKKSSTFHVQRSSVLDRVSKLLQSFKETKNDVKNIEIVEDGEPVIDMSVTLIDRDDENEYESDNDVNEESENRPKDKIIICSDSDSDLSENESEVYDEKNMLISADSESRVSENERDDIVLRNLLPLSNGNNTFCKKGFSTVPIGKNSGIYCDSDKTQECTKSVLKETKLFTSNTNSEQFDEISEVVLEDQNNNKFHNSDDELSNQECCGNEEKVLEDPNLDLELKTSVFPDSTSEYHKCVKYGERKRKLISVIEEVDEQHTCFPTKHKKV